MIDETDRQTWRIGASRARTDDSHRERGPQVCDIARTGSVGFQNLAVVVHDLESFAENARMAEAADNFLTVSEAVVRHKFEQGQVR
jgi:hypothetical protein